MNRDFVASPDSWRGPGPGRPDCRCPPTGCRCAAAAGGESAGGTWARTATSCCSAQRGSRSGRSDRRSGRSGTASAARCGSAPACGSRARAARSGRRRATTREASSTTPPTKARWCESRRARAKARCGRSSASGAGRWVESVCPNGEGEYVWTRKRADIPVRVRRPRRRAPLAGRGARDGGRVGRLPPAPHGMELVRRRRPHRRWALGRLEPGQRHQRPAAALRAGDLGGRRALRARPGRASRAWTRSPSTTEPGWSSAASASGEGSRTSCSLRYTYRQPFGSFSGTLPRRARARARPRRHGAPRRSLVARSGC